MYEMVEKHWRDICPYSQKFFSFDDAFNFVKNIPYREDHLSPECQYSDECVKAPLRTIEYGGDCDDKAVLLGAFARCFGLPFRIVTVSYDTDGNQTHTYIEVFWKDTWLPMDATYPQNTLGWEKSFTSKMLWT